MKNFEKNILKLLRRELKVNAKNEKKEHLERLIRIFEKDSKSPEEINLIENFLEFEREFLGRSIADLMTNYTGQNYYAGIAEERYNYQEPDYCPNLTVYDLGNGTYDWKTIYCIADIKPWDFNDLYLLRTSADKFYELAYCQNVALPQKINLGFYNDKGNFVAQKVFKSFPEFVQLFIAFVISYKIANNIVDIPEETYTELKEKFLKELNRRKKRKETKKLADEFADSQKEQAVSNSLNLKLAGPNGYEYTEEELNIMKQNKKRKNVLPGTRCIDTRYPNPIDLPELYLSKEEREEVVDKTIGRVLKVLEPKQKNDIN